MTRLTIKKYKNNNSKNNGWSENERRPSSWADCSPFGFRHLANLILAEYMSNICDTFMMAEDLLNNDNTISRDDYWQQFFSFKNICTT